MALVQSPREMSPKFGLVPQALTKTDKAARTNETCTFHFSK